MYIYVYISMIPTYLPHSWGCTSIWTLQRFRCDDGMEVGSLRRPTPRSVVKGGNAYRLPSPQDKHVEKVTLSDPNSQTIGGFLSYGGSPVVTIA